MLVLSRREGEDVVIVRDGVELCRVRVVDIRGDRARLGFTAPDRVKVHRLEVWEAICAGASEEESLGAAAAGQPDRAETARV